MDRARMRRIMGSSCRERPIAGQSQTGQFSFRFTYTRLRGPLYGEIFLTKVTPRQEFLIQRPKGDGGNAFEFSAIMVQSGQGSHSLDGRHKELRQSHWVLFGSDFAPGLSIQ
jgi:hypothetical protein